MLVLISLLDIVVALQIRAASDFKILVVPLFPTTFLSLMNLPGL